MRAHFLLESHLRLSSDFPQAFPLYVPTTHICTYTLNHARSTLDNYGGKNWQGFGAAFGDVFKRVLRGRGALNVAVVAVVSRPIDASGDDKDESERVCACAHVHTGVLGRKKCMSLPFTPGLIFSTCPGNPPATTMTTAATVTRLHSLPPTSPVSDVENTCSISLYALPSTSCVCVCVCVCMCVSRTYLQYLRTH